jgi:transposase
MARPGRPERNRAARSFCQLRRFHYVINSNKVFGHTAIRAADARLVFLPPYSPDLNPIEQVFAKLKILLRKAEERTIEGVWQRIGSLLQHFTPQECANYLRNAGYASI